MTDEETKEIVAADVKRQLAPKRPSPKKKIDPVKGRRCLDALERPPPCPPLSDYDRSIQKSHRDPQQRSESSGSARGKTIPQLGEQKNQSCPPLKVFTDIANDPGVAAADPAGFTLGDYIGDEVQFPMAELAYKYQHGKPLVRPEELPRLSTMMRRLHDWYLKASEEGTNYIIAYIKDEHYFNGDEEIFIEFEELFQLYNQDALDKTIVSCYCL
jgi:hypothetical protein